ncbi:MAG TPA: M20/M25/M40 family metallo-hydrolase, partial [Pirellulales bacterium]|jgi:tripeptide aminopeptidase|nr:M20/M25/M40 family metallo-hydrolase [Pirellulales bacterium]
VPLCVGSKPVVRGRAVQSGNPASGLGADDRAGCAVVLTAALEILRRGLDHPPLACFWPVQEEVGLFGAHYGQLALLGRPQLAFNWDGGPAEKITIGATGAFRLSIDVQGRASHAGAAPERGVSAVTIAGLAIADLANGGWLGDVRQPGGRQATRRGTSNIGIIHGGAATNVVTDHVQLKAEARSHDPAFRRVIVRAMEKAFRTAAASVRSADGSAGKVTINSRLDYESFHLPVDEPCIVAAEAAAQAVGLEPLRYVSNGGLDANWMTARGIPTVTLGCGQQDVHTLNERLNLDAFDHACRMALLLATGTEAS